MSFFNLFKQSSQENLQDAAKIAQEVQEKPVIQELIATTQPIKLKFTCEMLNSSKDKLKKVNLEENLNHNNIIPTQNSSWKFIKSWIKYNPRPFDTNNIIKFSNIILDKDFQHIRNKYIYVVKPEPNFIDEVIINGMLFGSYFILLNLCVGFYNVYRY